MELVEKRAVQPIWPRARASGVVIVHAQQTIDDACSSRGEKKYG
jgi:hypothetical protein